MAKASLKPASHIKISLKVASVKPSLSQAISSNSDDNKTKEHNYATKQEHDGFQFEQPDDSEKHFKTPKKRIKSETEGKLH